MLKRLAVHAVRSFNREVKAGEREGLSVDEVVERTEDGLADILEKGLKEAGGENAGSVKDLGGERKKGATAKGKGRDPRRPMRRSMRRGLCGMAKAHIGQRRRDLKVGWLSLSSPSQLQPSTIGHHTRPKSRAGRADVERTGGKARDGCGMQPKHHECESSRATYERLSYTAMRMLGERRNGKAAGEAGGSADGWMGLKSADTLSPAHRRAIVHEPLQSNMRYGPQLALCTKTRGTVTAQEHANPSCASRHVELEWPCVLNANSRGLVNQHLCLWRRASVPARGSELHCDGPGILLADGWRTATGAGRWEGLEGSQYFQTVDVSITHLHNIIHFHLYPTFRGALS
ncbi:hypothetical protein DFP72DRAFT_1094297 [Ephemerocybe angulata]|uniref:Uncharacterized protein n=1 Tax=Ephemerocybe angulata TaxID=980116 RepID=A0A8H6ME07_9AGAR|nr:hypothetical protein DFP72DRAFT_1094297 [Tulosesus angulatus]